MSATNNRQEIQTFQGCYYSSDHMDELTDAMNSIAFELKALNSQHSNVMRWLLITVCVLALGKALPEIKDVLWPSVKAEVIK